MPEEFENETVLAYQRRLKLMADDLTDRVAHETEIPEPYLTWLREIIGAVDEMADGDEWIEGRP
jgi:hypothetical protein